MPRNRILAGTGLAVLAAGLVGCHSANDVSFAAIKSNPSPELLGVANRNVDIERNMAVVGDQNLRMLTNDLNRMFLFDSPSYLSPWNIVSTTGQP
ncbi:MAG: hypothetical protein ACYTE2_00350 [Planctomycetota bacterium]|jgi:hypothetical protein